MEGNVSAWIKMARGAFVQPQPLWTAKNIERKTKLRLFRILLRQFFYMAVKPKGDNDADKKLQGLISQHLP